MLTVQEHVQRVAEGTVHDARQGVPHFGHHPVGGLVAVLVLQAFFAFGHLVLALPRVDGAVRLHEEPSRGRQVFILVHLARAIDDVRACEEREQTCGLFFLRHACHLEAHREGKTVQARGRRRMAPRGSFQRQAVGWQVDVRFWADGPIDAVLPVQDFLQRSHRETSLWQLLQPETVGDLALFRIHQGVRPLVLDGLRLQGRLPLLQLLLVPKGQILLHLLLLLHHVRDLLPEVGRVLPVHLHELDLRVVGLQLAEQRDSRLMHHNGVARALAVQAQALQHQPHELGSTHRPVQVDVHHLVQLHELIHVIL
mmetsp:Transcript_28930/g.96325  ORF Transcript_28930/g.96325 Transcript_28930/m.96325 type:complete len:311 (+) Transcript_28930:4888-5820(+)